MMNFKFFVLLLLLVHFQAVSQNYSVVVNLDTVSDVSERIRLYEELSISEQERNNFEKSLIYRSKYNALKDSLYAIDKETRQKEIESELGVDETDELLNSTENKLADSQKENQNLAQFLKANIYLTILVSLVIGAIVYFFIKNIRRRNNLVKEQRQVSTQYVKLNKSKEKAEESIQFIELHSKKEEETVELPDWVNKLSKKEAQVLKLLAKGMTDKEISEKMGVSLSTIRTYCRRIYTKLMVKNRSEAASFAVKHGLI